MPSTRPLDLTRLRVHPLAERRSLTSADDILVDPASPAPKLTDGAETALDQTVASIRSAREKGAQVILMYGAHLLRNGACGILTRLMEQGWITHLATNGAGTIHDWEYAWLGRSTESVEDNVAGGVFGTWEETGRNIHLALMTGALDELGYGRSLGRYIHEDGCHLPTAESLLNDFVGNPNDPLNGARLDLFQAMQRFQLNAGAHAVDHRWKHASILAQAWRLNVPVTVHPGIGYDIIACHPWFNGSVIGRGADMDFRLFAGAVDGLDDGVVLSVGSAIMAPQVFEKSLSCVHNLRFQMGRPPVSRHLITVVDLQDGGQWDWSKGEPPKSNPAYYLRFCKSFSRMGGTMQYVQADNCAFVHNLLHRLESH